MSGPVMDRQFPGDLSRYLESETPWAEGLLRKCISFPSIPGEEAGVMGFLQDTLRSLGGETTEMPIGEDLRGDADFVANPSNTPYSSRPNLLNRRKGARGGRSLIVCGHADVAPGTGEGAFSPRTENGYIFGRGACDDKGPLVAWLLALKALDHFRVQLDGDVETHVVIEEEVGGNGALSLIQSGRKADGVVVLEPSDLDVHPACRGALWFRIEVEGRSTHMATIQEGVNAAKEAIAVIQSLEKYEGRLLADSRDNPLFARYERPVMVNIGMLHSGDWPSTLPALATIEGGVGFLPNRSLAVVRREVEEAIVEGTGSWVRDHFRVSFDRLRNEAYQIDPEHPLVKAMEAACRDAGMQPAIHGMSASCDARLYHHRGGMPVIVFGPGSLRDAHSAQEKVRISDVVKAAHALFCLTYRWGGWNG